MAARIFSSQSASESKEKREWLWESMSKGSLLSDSYEKFPINCILYTVLGYHYNTNLKTGG